MQTVYVSQDGADFYVSLCALGDTQPTYVLSYPGKVRDFDMIAAEAARAWFKAQCARNDFTPKFDGDE